MKVLFICKSNVFRSQIAEAFFNKYAKDGEAKSAAVGDTQYEIHPFVIKAMEEKGLDVSGKKPKAISKDLTDWADLIVWMHRDVYDDSVDNKKREIWDFPDVNAEEQDAYSKIFGARDGIEEEIRKLIKKIEQSII